MVRVGTCGEPSAAFSDTVSRWLIPLSQLGVKVSVVPEAPGCLRPDFPRPPGSRPPDVLVQEWRTKGNNIAGDAVRTRVSFATAESLTITVSGRTFSAAIASHSLDFPTRAVVPGPMERDSPPEALFIQGMVASIDHQRRAATANDPATLAALVPVQERALTALEDADRRDVELFEPETSAVIKQLRAILILQGACSADTAAGLLRAAARLIPHDSEARAAAAIGRLKESNAPASCRSATEQELLQSLALNRWSARRVEDLGRFYELSMNAASARPGDRRAVSGDLAAHRLAQAWESRAPRAPMVLELGVSGGISKSVGAADLLRTLAPALRFDATLGRDSPGFGFRLGGTLPWTRELPLGSGTVSWTRFILSAGPRYRNRFGRFYWELDAAVLLAPAFATGHGFDTNISAVGLDGGVAAGARLGLRFGNFSLWTGGSGSYFAASHIPRWPDLTIRATGLTETSTLPIGDIAFLAGVSQMLWR